MDEADGADGDPEGAGHDCPAVPAHGHQPDADHSDRPSPGAFGPADPTEEERATILAMLSRRAECAPGASASAWARAGFKLAAIVMVVAGVGYCLGDGGEFDDGGCSVAQRPAKLRLGAASAESGKAGEARGPGNGTGAGNGDDGGAPGDRPECLVQAAMCQRRMPDGQCRMSGRLCGALVAQSLKAQAAVPVVAAKAVVKVVESAMERFERSLEAVRKLVLEVNRGGGVGSGIQVTQGEARKVFLLLKHLESGAKERKAPLAAVFRLLVLEGLSQRLVAGRCGCAESLISARVVTIESGFGMSIGRLRNFASELREMETAVKGERRRKKSSGAPEDFDGRDGPDEDVFGDSGEEV